MAQNRAPDGRGSSGRDVDRELARAQGARRLPPWAFATALGAGAIAWAAGGGAKGAATVAALGLVFVLFVWTTSVARCPLCGAPLRRGRAAQGQAGARAPARPDGCPSCHARFD